MFENRSLTDGEIENLENYPTVFLNTDSKKWDPYNESYKLNEDSFWGSRGDMVLPSATYKQTLVTEVNMSVAGHEDENNDMVDAHVATIDTVTHSSSSTRSDITQSHEWG